MPCRLPSRRSDSVIATGKVTGAAMRTGAKGSTAQDTENWRWKRTTGRVREAAMGAGAKGSRAQDRDRSAGRREGRDRAQGRD